MEIASRIISWLFLPLLMPIYALLATMYVPSQQAGFFQHDNLFAMPPGYKYFVLLWFIFFAVLAPGFSLVLLKRGQRISNIHLDRREERLIPILITALFCLLLGITLIYKAPNGVLARAVYALPWGGFFSILLAGLITRYEKISLHALGAGMLFGFLVAYFRTQSTFVFPVLLLSALIGGLVLAARMYLGKHTLRQSLSGYVLGAIVMFTTVALFPSLTPE
jgi:membrane-associated phospholipid phosphatase